MFNFNPNILFVLLKIPNDKLEIIEQELTLLTVQYMNLVKRQLNFVIIQFYTMNKEFKYVEPIKNCCVFKGTVKFMDINNRYY